MTPSRATGRELPVASRQSRVAGRELWDPGITSSRDKINNFSSELAPPRDEGAKPNGRQRWDHVSFLIYVKLLWGSLFRLESSRCVPQLSYVLLFAYNNAGAIFAGEMSKYFKGDPWHPFIFEWCQMSVLRTPDRVNVLSFRNCFKIRLSDRKELREYWAPLEDLRENYETEKRQESRTDRKSEREREEGRPPSPSCKSAIARCAPEHITLP